MAREFGGATGYVDVTADRDRLSDYKIPRQVAFVAELPRNATGKVLKQHLGDCTPIRVRP